MDSLAYRILIQSFSAVVGSLAYRILVRSACAVVGSVRSSSAVVGSLVCTILMGRFFYWPLKGAEDV